MKTTLAVCLAGLCLAYGAEVNPLNKVIQLLEDMAKKGKAEMDAEQVLFQTAMQWCQDTKNEVQHNIDKENDGITQNKAFIEKASADIMTLGTEIKELGAEIDRLQESMDTATADRKKENEDYLAMNTDYSESIDALGRAIKVLSKQNFKRNQAEDKEALLQLLTLKNLPNENRQMLQSYLQTVAPPGLVRSTTPKPIGTEDAPNPAAYGYEPKLNGVIDMLKQLKSKFKSERFELQKGEMNSEHNFNMNIQDLTSRQEGAKDMQQRKQGELKSTEAAQGVAKGELADNEAALASDTEYLQKTTANCELKSNEFKERRAVREGEIEAIGQAIGVLQSGDVGGNVEKHLPTMLSQQSFLQHRSFLSHEADQIHQVTQFLQGAAMRTGSATLSLAAVRASELAPNGDMKRPGVSKHFEKVIGMIRDLIFKLKDEQTAEQEKNAWCQTEVAKNKQKRESLTAQRDTLKANVEGYTAKIANLAEQMSDLNDEISEAEAALNKATEERNQQQALNQETIADAQAGQAGVQNAIKILKDFYAGAAKSTALISKAQKAIEQEAMPDTWDKKYTGQQGSSQGVFSLLEVCESDFARLNSETTQAEASQSAAFRDFKNETETNIAVKNADLEDRTTQKTRTETKNNEATKSLNGVQTELDAANDVFQKLKPDCMDTGLSYEERVARRAQEIVNLKEALTLLKPSE